MHEQTGAHQACVRQRGLRSGELSRGRTRGWARAPHGGTAAAVGNPHDPHSPVDTYTMECLNEKTTKQSLKHKMLFLQY